MSKESVCLEGRGVRKGSHDSRERVEGEIRMFARSSIVSCPWVLMIMVYRRYVDTKFKMTGSDGGGDGWAKDKRLLGSSEALKREQRRGCISLSATAAKSY